MTLKISKKPLIKQPAPKHLAATAMARMTQGRCNRKNAIILRKPYGQPPTKALERPHPDGVPPSPVPG